MRELGRQLRQLGRRRGDLGRGGLPRPGRAALRTALIAAPVLIMFAIAITAVLVTIEQDAFETDARAETRRLLVVLDDGLTVGQTQVLARALRRPGELEVILVAEDEVLTSSQQVALDDVPDDLRDIDGTGPRSRRTSAADEQFLVVAGAGGRTRAYLFFAEDRLEARNRTVATTVAAASAGLLVVLSAGGWGLTRRRLRTLELVRRRERAFGAHLAHELRNPVGSLVTAASLVEESALADLAEPVRGPVRVMRTEARRLHSIVDDLLEISRLETGQIEARSEVVDVDDLARSILTDYRFAGVAVTGDRGVQVLADRQSLARVLLNLIGNAVRHAGTSVELRISHDATTATLEVVDDGPGIPGHVLEGLGRGWPVVSGSDRFDDTGHGLGLLIAHAHAELLHTELRIVSEPDRGTGVSLGLPLASPAVPARDA